MYKTAALISGLILIMVSSCASMNNQTKVKYDYFIVEYPEQALKVQTDPSDSSGYANFMIQLNIQNSSDLYRIECHPLEREPSIGFYTNGVGHLGHDGIAQVGALFTEPCVVTKWILRIRKGDGDRDAPILYTDVIDYRVEWK